MPDKPASPPDLAAMLTKAERARDWPNVRPKDAATLILLDQSGRVPKILMGRRNPAQKFMPGKFVFPGGRIEPSDHRMNVAGALPSIVEQRLLTSAPKRSPHRPRALALAAIRETYEETGLALGTKEHGTPDNTPKGTWQEFAQHGVYPALDDICLIARAITPPRRPKRFDTCFFALDASLIVHQKPGITGPEAELVELAWLPLAEAHQLDLPSITRVILMELEARLKAGMGHHLPVPFYHEKNRRWHRDEL